MGSSLVNVKSERQACRLEPQAGADPDLEAEFLPPPGSLRFCSKGLWLTGWGNHSVEGDLLCLTSDDRCELHPQTTLRQHLDKCLVNHWRLAWPCWHRRLTITVPVKLFPLKNLSIYIVIIAFCSPLGFAVNYVFCGDQNKWGLLLCVHDRLNGKRGYVLEILKCSMPFPDLWSSGMLDLMQAWAGKTASVF